MNEPTGKRCTKCGKVKPLLEFGRDRSKPGGYGPCKECTRKKSRLYRAANPEKIRQANRQYRIDNPEYWREANRRQYAANPEKFLERNRRWREANPQKVREITRRWKTANPKKVRESNRRDRDRIRTAVFDHYGRSCACCGATENLTIDHVDGNGKQHRLKLSGGNITGIDMYRRLVRDGFPDDIRLQVLCAPCNSSKGTGAACQLTHLAA